MTDSSDFSQRPGAADSVFSRSVTARGYGRGRRGRFVFGGAVLLVFAVAGVVVAMRANANGTLKRPVFFQQVLDRRAGRCAGPGTPSADGASCYRLAAAGLTVTKVISIRAHAPDSLSRSWRVTLGLKRADIKVLRAFTTRLAAQESPRDELAIVVDGKAVDVSEIHGAFFNNVVRIHGFAGKANAKRFIRHLRS